MEEYKRRRGARPANSFVGWLFLLVFGLFWCTVVAFMDSKIVPPIIQQYSTKTFKPVLADIEKSQVVAVAGKRNRSYRAELEYSYRVSDKTYTGNLYTFDSLTAGSKSRAAEAVAAFPAGSKRTAFYDPVNPARAVLRTGVQGAHITHIMFLGIFNMIALVMIVGAPYAWLNRNPPPIIPPRWRERAGNREAYAMQSYSPLITFVAAFIATNFIGLMILGIAADMNPSLQFATWIWGTCIGLSVCAAYFAHRKSQSGQTDLVFDFNARTLILPAMHGRATKEILPLGDAAQFSIKEIPRGAEGNKHSKHSTWSVTLRMKNNAEFPLYSAVSEADAQRMTRTLNEKIGYLPDFDASASAAAC